VVQKESNLTPDSRKRCCAGRNKPFHIGDLPTTQRTEVVLGVCRRATRLAKRLTLALAVVVLESLTETWATKWDGRWHYEVHDRGFRHEGGSGAVLVYSVEPTSNLEGCEVAGARASISAPVGEARCITKADRAARCRRHFDSRAMRLRPSRRERSILW
jgi:hypothetical protein